MPPKSFNCFLILFIFSFVFRGNLIGQQILTDTVHSRILNKPVPITVMIPKGLENGRDLPVFYFLHSWGGNHEMYLSPDCELKNRYSDFPFLVVMPSADTCWYVNTKGLPNSMYGTFMEKELFPFVDEKYHCAPERQGIGGHSMGGYGALVVGLKNPRRFRFIANMSGAINVPFEGIPVTPFMEPVMKSVKDIFGDGNSKVSKSNDVIRLAKKLKLKPAKRPFVYLAIGKQDEYDFLLTANREYAGLIDGLGYPHSYTEFEAGHFTYDVINMSLEGIKEGMIEAVGE